MSSKKSNQEERDFELYQTLINARNFHYENFNKWASYFYIAIGSLFVGYYTSKTGNDPDEILVNAILVLGFIVSLLWYWSCKGYYYWNINWIMLVNEFEENVLNLSKERKIYTVFADKNTQNSYLNPISGANISTSKIVILFSFCVAVIWGVLIIEELEIFELNGLYRFFAETGISLIVVILFSMLVGLWHKTIGKINSEGSIASDHSKLLNRKLNKHKRKSFFKKIFSLE